MTQGKLPFKYEEEKAERGKTAMSGLPVYLELASVLGMTESISKHLPIKVQGWRDEQIVLSLVLLNIAGGDCVDDLKILEKDEGFCRVLRRVEQKGMSRQRGIGSDQANRLILWKQVGKRRLFLGLEGDF